MLLRRSQNVRDPSGEWWYVHARKGTMRAELLGDPYARNTKILDHPFEDVASPDVFLEGLVLSVVRLPFALLFKLVSSLLGPLIRRRAGPEEARSRAVWIEVTSRSGSRTETRYYLVTGPDVDGPFAEVVAGLEQGKLVQPAGAEYKGSRVS